MHGREKRKEEVAIVYASCLYNKFHWLRNAFVSKADEDTKYTSKIESNTGMFSNTNSIFRMYAFLLNEEKSNLFDNDGIGFVKIILISY